MSKPMRFVRSLSWTSAKETKKTIPKDSATLVDNKVVPPLKLKPSPSSFGRSTRKTPDYSNEVDPLLPRFTIAEVQTDQKLIDDLNSLRSQLNDALEALRTASGQLVLASSQLEDVHCDVDECRAELQTARADLQKASKLMREPQTMKSEFSSPCKKSSQSDLAIIGGNLQTTEELKPQASAELRCSKDLNASDANSSDAGNTGFYSKDSATQYDIPPYDIFPKVFEEKETSTCVQKSMQNDFDDIETVGTTFRSDMKISCSTSVQTESTIGLLEMFDTSMSSFVDEFMGFAAEDAIEVHQIPRPSYQEMQLDSASSLLNSSIPYNSRSSGQARVNSRQATSAVTPHQDADVSGMSLNLSVKNTRLIPTVSEVHEENRKPAGGCCGHRFHRGHKSCDVTWGCLTRNS